MRRSPSLRKEHAGVAAVGAGATVDRVVALAGGDLVVACATIDDVVAVARVDHVAVGTSVPPVGDR